MLSYMLPVDEKPPPVPRGGGGASASSNHHHHLQLSLANGRIIGKDASFTSDSTATTASRSSSSSLTTPNGLVAKNGGVDAVIAATAAGKQHQLPLKRVSFGSSKGSMVETLIYESPLQEESEQSPAAENCPLVPLAADSFQPPHSQQQARSEVESEREKVRVTFSQRSKPQVVDLPDEPFDAILCCDLLPPDSAASMMAGSNATASALVTVVDHAAAYNRQESVESGWDNPFRPGGDLSREADEIVELIKGGKPITPTSTDAPSAVLLADAVDMVHQNGGVMAVAAESPPQKKSATPISYATPLSSTNGNAAPTSPPGSVDVQRGTVVPAGDASQVEHVVIKKKPKCKCCVIQ